MFNSISQVAYFKKTSKVFWKFLIDIRIYNTMDKPVDSKLTDAQFVLKVIEVGLHNIRYKDALCPKLWQ